MKSILLASAMFAAASAVAIVPASAQSAKKTHAEAAMQQKSSSKTAMTAQKFVDMAGPSNQFEIDSSQSALEKAKSPELKQFAQQMITDHGKAADDMQMALQSEQGVTAPSGLDKKHQQELDQVNSAKNFDKAYTTAQVKAHKEAVALFTQYSESGEDGALKTFAAQTLPTLKMHYKMIQDIAKKMS
ncbi:putative membrane protein [Faunimonas pinastri]|uniref:Putative membrane protein n=1 Tax=Faunimonas pinastri TaxID=1855383 RepID=A0A1H9A0K6_9HYPH|nr:DUF4142 domain-containing protein [Faunimonas pinastri]SEP70210.1 putative membrane protein [Faunimonas pinastri]